MNDRILAMRESLEKNKVPVIYELEMKRHVEKGRVMLIPPPLPALPDNFYECTKEEQGRPI
jgi:hypothetical protein